MDASSQKLFVVDGMSLLFRSFYAMGRVRMTSPDGTPTGAIYGFLKIIFKILKEQQPTHFAIAWDLKEKTFRHDMFPEYKSNRSETPADLIPQIKLIHQLLPEMGFASLSLAGFEADDLIGTLAKRYSQQGEVYIVSSDKDFMQLIDDRVKLFSLKSGDNYEVLGRQQVIDYFGVPPEHVIDILALTGDAADFVPGVKGIGEKGASKLIAEFGTLEDVYENIKKVSNKRLQGLLETGRESAFLSKKLVTIATEAPVVLNENAFQFDWQQMLANPHLRNWLDQLRMTSIIRSLYEGTTETVKPKGEWPAAVKSKASKDIQESLFDDVDDKKTAELKEEVAESPLATWKRRDYKCVKTWSELEQVLSKISQPSTKVFAIDTETTGLDILQDKPIGFSVSFAEGEGFYIPVQGVDAPFTSQQNEVWQALNTALSKRSGIAVAHNLKFDAHMLTNVGVDVFSGPYACSMIATWLLDSQANAYGLDAQSLKVLGLRKIPTTKLIGKQAGRTSMLEAPLDLLIEYAVEDVDATFRLWSYYKDELEKSALENLFWEIEMPILRMLVEMERQGVFLDTVYLDELSLQLQTRVMEIEQRVYEIAGQVFNLSSPKQLGVVLFEHLKVHQVLGYKGKLAKTTLGYKTDAGVLDTFSEHEFVKLIIEHRELSKLLGTYVLALPQLIKPTTKRIHTSFHQHGTATGRLSSNDPNLQNIPVRTAWGKKVRAAFSAQDESHVILSADYSQIELRVLAHLAQDESMLEAFRSGRDIHRETAAKIQGKNPEDITPEERSAAKAINFGIIYGMGPQRLAKEQGVSLAQAKTFIEKYFLNFSKIREYLDSQKIFGYENGFVRTYFGRIRKLPGLKSANPGEARMWENVAINTPIQGTAADIMKIGMLKTREAILKNQVKAKVILQVHDELVLECPKNEVEKVSQLVIDAMQSAVEFSVPFLVEVGVGKNWLEAK